MARQTPVAHDASSLRAVGDQLRKLFEMIEATAKMIEDNDLGQVLGDGHKGLWDGIKAGNKFCLALEHKVKTEISQRELAQAMKAADEVNQEGEEKAAEKQLAD